LPSKPEGPEIVHEAASGVTSTEIVPVGGGACVQVLMKDTDAPSVSSFVSGAGV